MRVGARVFTVIVAAAVLLGAAGGAEPGGEDPPTHLQRVVDRLGEEASAFDRGGIIGISVMRLDTGERADFQGDRWLKAASSLKPTWLVTAIRTVGIGEVAPLFEGVFRRSSNKVGGRAIGLGGGLDAVNAFTSSFGMSGTLVVEWTFGGDYRSSEYPGPHPALNFTTADDLVTFWRRLYQGWMLSSADTATFLDWAREERLVGYSSGLLTRLPEEVRPHVAYKMGWLPPGRTEEDEETGEIVEVDALDVLIGSGIVEIPGGPTYVVAIGSFGGSSWPGKVNFISYASCRIYRAISGDDVDCDRPGDPRRVRLNTDPPIGGLARVSGGPEFLEVSGWAVDPDRLDAAARVRFTVDGRLQGGALADDRHSHGADAFAAEPGHGFHDTLLVMLAPGEHEVCLIGINDGPGVDPNLGCLLLTTGD